MPFCTACGQENPEQARFCLACGSPLAPPAPPHEERKLVTALFCDVVGSTATAEQLDPEDVRARLAPYYARVRAELERFGGTVEKFIGDAVVALFGAPTAHEDDPERAVRAAFAVREAIADLNEADAWLDLKIRIGVNTGEALVVVGARAREGEAMAAGDVLNTAARLQSAAPVDGVLVGEQTYRATAHAIDYREAEPISAKGKAEPVRVWEAVAARAAPGPRPVSRVPLVGRDADLGRLLERWHAVRDTGEAALVTLLGPPGIGKSRLLAELGDRAGADGRVLTGRCLSYGEGITYWPVTSVVKDAAGILQSDDADEMTRKLGTLLDGLPTDDLDQLRTMAAALANLIGVATTPRGTYSVEEIGRAELHWGVRRVLELLAAERPLLLVFEDLHWAEPTLLELVRFLAESSAPLLVAGSARPELAETQAEFVAGRSLALDALGQEESEALLGRLLGESALPGATAAAVLRNAGGNPLFLEETVRMLENGGPTVSPGASLPVPTSLQALIGSRLDQLPAEEKRLAQHASVVGAVFWPGALAHLDGDADPAEQLSDLEHRDLVRAHPTSTVAGEREYGFKHILIRDVAYGQLPKGERAGLHQRFAEWVTMLPGGEDEFVEIVAYHLEQSCRLAGEVAHSPVPPPVEMAVEALSRAAEKAERREGFREADRFYARALELVEPGAEPVTELRLHRCRMLTALGELRPAKEALVEVVAEAAAQGRSELRCAGLVALAGIDLKQGRPSEARPRLTEAEALAAQIGDRGLQIRAIFELSNLHGWFEAATESAVDDLRRAVAIAEEMDDRPLRVEGHLRLGGLLFNVGELDQAAEHLALCTRLAGEAGSHRDEARAAYMLGFVRFYLGDADEAERLGLQAADWLERTADSYMQLQNARALAKYALARGDADLAERRLRDALPAALEAGGWVVIEVYRYLVDALLIQDRLEEARELVAFAARNLPEEDLYARAALLLATGSVAAAAGEQGSAATSFEEALRLLEEQELLTDLGEARIAFAGALRGFGETTGARAELERARAIFKRMGAEGLLAEIDHELGELVEGADEAGPLQSG